MIDQNRKNDILLIVDFQHDFIMGSLAVPGAEKLIPIIKSYIEKFQNIIFTKDWHPERHCSFVGRGGWWPVHCVQDTKGAKIHEELLTAANNGYVTFAKGYIVGREDY
jgi:nicotinamidase/pyrazinamidase